MYASVLNVLNEQQDRAVAELGLLQRRLTQVRKSNDGDSIPPKSPARQLKKAEAPPKNLSDHARSHVAPSSVYEPAPVCRAYEFLGNTGNPFVSRQPSLSNLSIIDQYMSPIGTPDPSAMPQPLHVKGYPQSPVGSSKSRLSLSSGSVSEASARSSELETPTTPNAVSELRQRIAIYESQNGDVAQNLDIVDYGSPEGETFVHADNHGYATQDWELVERKDNFAKVPPACRSSLAFFENPKTLEDTQFPAPPLTVNYARIPHGFQGAIPPSLPRHVTQGPGPQRGPGQSADRRSLYMPPTTSGMTPAGAPKQSTERASRGDAAPAFKNVNWPDVAAPHSPEDPDGSYYGMLKMMLISGGEAAMPERSMRIEHGVEIGKAKATKVAPSRCSIPQDHEFGIKGDEALVKKMKKKGDREVSEPKKKKSWFPWGPKVVALPEVQICESALTLQVGTHTAPYKLKTRLGGSLYYQTRATSYYKCMTKGCYFEGRAVRRQDSKGKDHADIDRRVFESDGILYRWEFLFRSHLKLEQELNHPVDSPFGCLFCCFADKTPSQIHHTGLRHLYQHGTPIFFGVASFMNHLQSHRSGSYHPEAVRRMNAIVDRCPLAQEDFSIALPPRYI